MLKEFNENFDFPAEMIEKKLEIVIYTPDDKAPEIDACYNAKII